MRKIIAIVVFFVTCSAAFAQQGRIDSLLNRIDQTTDDDKIDSLFDLANRLPNGVIDLLHRTTSQLKDSTSAVAAPKNTERLLYNICRANYLLHDAPQLLNAALSGIRISRRISDRFYLAHFYHAAGIAYLFQQDYRNSVACFLASVHLGVPLHDRYILLRGYSNLETLYIYRKDLDSATYYARMELASVTSFYFSRHSMQMGSALSDMGEVMMKKGMPDSALFYFRRAYAIEQLHPQPDIDPYTKTNLARVFLQLGKRDSAIKYASESYAQASKTRIWEFISAAAGTLAEAYQDLDDKKSLYYLRAQMAAGDSVNALNSSREFQLINDKEKQRVQDLKVAQERFNTRIRLYVVIGVAIILLIIGIILWRTNKKQKRTNFLLSEQKEEISSQRDELESKNAELEIEAALERVRTVAMSMNKPEDMLNISRALFAELSALQFSEMRNAMIQTYFDEKRYFDDYDYSDFAGGHINSIPYNQNSIVDKFLNEIRRSKDAFSEIAITGDDMERWIKFRDSNNETPDERLYHTSSLYYYFYSVGGAAIGISTFHPIPPGELEIVKRFRNVFDLAYQRYVDISNALAQAHEARIQTALERVRAAVMAMKKTDEAVAICEVMYNELLSLGIGTIRNAQIAEKNESMQAYLLSAYSPEGSISQLAASYNAPITKALYDELGQSRETFYEREFSGESIEEWRRWRESLAPLTNPRERDAVSLCFYLFSFGDGHIGISTYEIIPQEQIDLLKRFKKVFELGYTRFADVKRAEAQAREARIEAALERVRSRSMGMQKSEELKEVIQVVFDQFVRLNIGIDHTGFVVDYKPGTDWHFWIADPIGSPNKLTVGYFESVWGKDFNEAKKKGIDFFTTKLDFDQKNKFYRDMFEHFPEMPQEYRDNIFGKPGLAASTVLMEDVALYIENFSGTPYTDEENAVLMRFGKVFQQTYTRFLDLQKAEEQARESQIQLALERVRARTMAMQKSEELAETVSLLFKQLLALGIRTEQIRTCGIVTFADNEPIGEQWITETNGEIIPKSFMVPYNEAPAYKAIYNGWKHGEEFMVIHLGGEKLKEHLGYLAKDTNVPTRDVVLPQQAKEIFNHVMFFSQGCLFIITKEALPGYHDVFKRFGAVFQQSYTRFLDLKKAEAQAREAQIESALEKVRSRSLAMHKSDELQEVVTVVFKQLRELGISIDGVSICTFIEGTKDIIFWTAVNDDLYSAPIYFPYFDHPVPADFFKAKESGLEFYAKAYTVDEKNSLWNYNFKHTAFKNLPGERKKMILESQGYTFAAAWAKNSAIAVNNFAGVLFSERDADLIKRFSRAFEQAYIRFLDLEKAEEQARESQIQLALERVRARTMAMQKSEELAEVIQVVYQQLIHLGFNIGNAGFAMDYRASEDLSLWMADAFTEYPTKVHIPYFDHRLFKEVKDAKTKGLDLLTISMTFDEKNKWLDHLLKYIPGVPEEVKAFGYSAPGYALTTVWMQNTALYANNLSNIPYSDAENATLMRFGQVFEQTYTRFLDLQKAETQAREAQIETALERVRARTMAMQKSVELTKVIQLIFEQFVLLDFNIDNANFVMDFRPDDGMSILLASRNQNVPVIIFVPYFDHVIFNNPIAALARGADHYETKLTFEEKNVWFDHYFKNAVPLPDLPRAVLDSVYNRPGYFTFGAIMKPVTLSIANYEGYVYTDAEQAVVMRFGKVFEQTYTRFLDLQKAEAQAREAQIEAALERVRARAMSMHQSQDINNSVLTVFEELEKLDLEILRCGIGIIDKENQVGDIWTTVRLDGKSSIQVSGKEPMNIHPLMQGTYDAWLKQNDFLYELKGDDLAAYYRAVAGTNFTLPESHSLTDESHGARQYYYTPTFKTGNLYAFRESPFPDDAKSIMRRFASVLNLTFSRFLDLQKAEAQAREAQIEASLERVRSKAMSMRDSNDLLAAASMVFTELHNLGINQIRSGVGLVAKDFHNAKVYSATSSQNVVDLSLMGEVTLNGHPVFEQQYQSWLKGENYFVALEGKELASYYKILSAGLNANLGITVKKNQKEYGHWFMFSEGFLYAWSDKEYTDAEIRILERFKNVMELTIRRYIELQNSEMQAREAVRQASLDRVRAEIASMRSISDLDRITPLIWNELTTLGVPFIRCGVFIMDEQQQLIHTYLSTPDGKAIAAFQLPFSSDSGNRVNGTALRGWREKQAVTLHWTEEEFRTFSHSLVEQGEITSEENYLTGHLPTGLDLHFFPFLQGMLYAGNTAPLSDDEKDLVQSLADAFSTAYARYEDFNRLETAKQEVERTLTDLRTAQTRLIQSEKMASLGELTAGIAHEIQNPLNFVNNFSEVNKEMLEELKAESEKPKAERDEQLEIELINGLIKNEEKINHHGKRADGIVKGMLQHSRTAGGEKLPTNMNSVAEEYMRLSYHGLRAKDKSFNAEMIMHFDPDLPRIQAVGQDIGRVFLNLFNNAFYAVNLKKKAGIAGYNPEVSVSTSIAPQPPLASGGAKNIIIIVRDNGIGMPEQVKEKIMQPFFTTKPTGEGTGLGLSLTYDMVVKGHGGSIQVNSIEGEGSEFIISLPI